MSNARIRSRRKLIDTILNYKGEVGSLGRAIKHAAKTQK